MGVGGVYALIGEDEEQYQGYTDAVFRWKEALVASAKLGDKVVPR
jgi:hypothetical protein